MNIVNQFPDVNKKVNTMHIGQIELVGGILTALKMLGVPDEINCRQMNSVIEAANLIVAEFARDHQSAVSDMGLRAWLTSDDTGLSSKYMVRVLHQKDFRPEDIHWPHDPSDFGRCLRLLEAVPELRGSLQDMAETCPQWKSIIENWTELESLYQEEFPTGQAPKLYDRMKALGL